MQVLPSLQTLDGKDRSGEEVDTDECMDDNQEDVDDDEEDDYGDEQDFEADGVKARKFDLKKMEEGISAKDGAEDVKETIGSDGEDGVVDLPVDAEV